MKKYLTATALILAVLLLLCSCLSLNTNVPDYTEEEAREAMNVLMNKTIENANTRFFQKLSTYSFIPDGYASLKTNQENIPGMKSILDDWNKTMSAFLEANKEVITDSTIKAVKNTQYYNALNLVSKSNTSGSEYLKTMYNEDFINLLLSVVTNADFEILDRGVSQYNAWVENENHKNNTNKPKIENTDVVSQIATVIYDYYKDNVMMFEEFFRTTPDPFAEDIIKKVFGVK